MSIESSTTFTGPGEYARGVSERELTSNGPPAPLSRPRVLVVDDQQVERCRIGKLVEREAGLQVLEARNGAEALQILARDTVDIVLSDLWMPVMDGLALVESIRAIHPGIPVILMTGEGSEDMAMKALRAGASQYVPKRELSKELAGSVGRVLQLAKAENRRNTILRCLVRCRTRYRIGNEPSLFTPLVDQLIDDLARMGLGDSTGRMRVGVALHESLANAMYHGNLELDSALRQTDGERPFYNLAEQRRFQTPYRDRRVVVDSVVSGTTATYTIRDDGPGFEARSIGREIDPEDLLQVGGRGLLLIRAFMDEVHHNSRGNAIRMRKHFMIRE